MAQKNNNEIKKKNIGDGGVTGRTSSNNNNNNNSDDDDDDRSSNSTAAAVVVVRNDYVGGWRYVFGCTRQSLVLFRISLGSLLILELVLRYRYIRPFYSNDGTLPLRLLMSKVDTLYQYVCFHCQFGQIHEQQILLTIQVILAILYTAGINNTKLIVTTLSWYLYFSLTLRNTWLNYILDRYFHYLLFISMILVVPFENQQQQRCYYYPSIKSNTSNRSNSRSNNNNDNIVISPGTIALKILVVWIYIDAGYGKLMDPLGGWTYNADPLPALDTYARHTLIAQYLYGIIGPYGLRILTPVVVYIELLSAPIALLGSYLGSRSIVYTAVVVIVSMHVGIALTLRNAALLSFVACTPWCAFLPIGLNNKTEAEPKEVNTTNDNTSSSLKSKSKTNKFSPSTSTAASSNNHYFIETFVSSILLISMFIGCLWFATMSEACDQSVTHIWSTLLHNRWNVFVGAEEYVTWEIAPGLLQDGTIVDVWSRSYEPINWNLPTTGAPCTAAASSSNARPGRWRSFPYLAELKGDDAYALWNYLCTEWDATMNANNDPEKKLVRYNFFMLQADVLPNMGFSPTRKRLIQSWDCTTTSSSSFSSTAISYEGSKKDADLKPQWLEGEL